MPLSSHCRLASEKHTTGPRRVVGLSEHEDVRGKIEPPCMLYAFTSISVTSTCISIHISTPHASPPCPPPPATVSRILHQGWLAGWLAGRPAGRLAGWLAGFLAGCLAGWLAGWLASWLAGRPTGWLMDRWTNGRMEPMNRDRWTHGDCICTSQTRGNDGRNDRRVRCVKGWRCSLRRGPSSTQNRWKLASLEKY